MSFGTTVQLTYGISDSLVVRQDFHWITGIRKSKLWCIYKSMCILTIFFFFSVHITLCPLPSWRRSTWQFNMVFLAGVASLWLCCRNWFMESLNQFYKVSIPSSKSISQMKIFLISKYILPGKYKRPWYCVCATF